MSAYVLFHFDVTDQEAFKRHGQAVMESVRGYDAEFLVPPTPAQSLEGESPRSMNVLLRFPSEETARDWYHSDRYGEGKKVRAGELNMVITLLGNTPVE